MNNATLAVRVRPDHPNHHLPPSPAACGATVGREGDGEFSIRILSGHPNHHLWNNNGTWWCHYTIHRPDFTKQRVRISLDTCDPREARAKRDAILAARTVSRA